MTNGTKSSVVVDADEATDRDSPDRRFRRLTNRNRRSVYPIQVNRWRLSSSIRGWSHFVETVRYCRGVRLAHRVGHGAVRSRSHHHLRTICEQSGPEYHAKPGIKRWLNP